MLTPRLFFGRSDNPYLLKANDTFLDDAVAYDLLAVSNRVAPAGTGGECIFTALHLSLTTFDTTVRLKVTPIIDNVALAAQIVDTTGVGSSQGEVKVHKLPLSVPYVPSGTELSRHYPRGTWIQVQVETDHAGKALGPEIVNEIAAEHEVVRETKAAG